MAKNKTITLDDLSHADKVLISLFRVSNGTTSRVPFENLVLQAWRDFPIDFGLPNNLQHPDSSVVSKRLYSDLITKRLVVSLKNKVYRLSDKGIKEAQKILGLATTKKENNKNVDILLNRDEEQFLDNALRSKTFSVWKKGDKQDLIDYDVRVFFQFSTGTPIKERKRRVETAEDALQKALTLRLPEADELKKLFEFLVQRFPKLFQEK
jgi:DNA-binding PadR family transcriptional regulator